MTRGLEKRKFQRLDYSLEVAVEIVTGDEAPRVLPPVHVKSHNISKTGICLETKVLEIHGINLLSGSPYRRGNRLHMKIKLITEEAPFHAIGEVLWYDVVRDTAGFTYQLGVESLWVSFPAACGE
ncbi:MAG: PilZ domain-containing protein [Syntrophales bacterium]|nr:PilZ domain-containing protein [Syntrophales bacterium]